MKTILPAVPHPDLASLLSATMLRLILAAVLGGIIGLERELKRRPAGLRTNMFMCFGSALFTICSIELAVHAEDDHTRIAAQIVNGIGFIGAGAILHARGSVTGLTTAATIFVVSAIGMAVGGGLYVPAIFATLLVFIALEVLGVAERRFNLKPALSSYEVLGESAEAIIAEVSSVLELLRKSMEGVRVQREDGRYRVEFSVLGTRAEQAELFQQLRLAPTLRNISSLGQTAETE
ncbi:MAG TPA: MgtC/SapB family protein [Terriglobales bacterium]|nr:MgtC/SapB family protein [Terriglobales bacterium]